MQPDQPQDRLKSLNVAGQERRFNASYSRLVRWLRLVLPLMAIGIIAVLVNWIGYEDAGVVAEKPKIDEKSAARNELINPNFESVDSKNQPYSITALRATQSDVDDKLVFLDKPSGRITLNGGNQLTLQATEGSYQQEQEKLVLQGEVSLSDAQGYTVRTPQVHVDIKNARAWSSEAVRGEGPLGLLEAAGFEARTDEDKLIFKGPARVVVRREAL